MSKLFARFAKNNSGATAIEYGLIAAIMAVMLIAAFPTLTKALSGTFGTIGTALTTPPR